MRILAMRAGRPLIFVGVLVALAGCVSEHTPLPTPRPAHASAAPTPVTVTGAECLAPGGTTITPDGEQSLSRYGVWSEPWTDPPGAAQLDYLAPMPLGSDHTLKDYKTPFFVSPNEDVTISVLSPTSARLFATTLAQWNRLSGQALDRGQTTRLRLQGCDGIASYPGLTLVKGPVCVVLRVEREGARPADIRVPFFGAGCP